MITARIRTALDSLRDGYTTGFVVGLVMLFLLLLGLPIRLASLGLFFVLFVPFIFGWVLARRLFGQPILHLARNVLALGIAGALVVFLFMSLINHWHATGVNARDYFDAMGPEAMTALSGVPVEELHADPEPNPLTGEYPEGAQFRTDPMRLTFKSENGLRLKIGLTGDPWFEINLVIGGFYGFMLVIVIAACLGAALNWIALTAELGRRYRTWTAGNVAGNPIAHWLLLLSPVLVFAVVWLTESQGSRAAVIDIGTSAREAQLLAGFGIILSGLVAIRASQPVDWGLDFPVRLGMISAVVIGVLSLGIWRVVDANVYVVPLGDNPRGSEIWTVLALVLVGAILVVQNYFALRQPERFESQFAASTALAAFVLVPLYMDQYQNDVLTLVGIYILLGLGLNIVVGYAGLLDLGYVAFFALGAYSYAFLSSNQVLIDDAGEISGYRFEGNDEVAFRVTGAVITTLLIATLVVIAGLYLWRRWQVRRADGMARVATSPRPPLLASGLRYGRQAANLALHRPDFTVTFLIAVAAIGFSLLFSVVLDRAGLYGDIFGSIAPFWIGLIVGVIVAGLSGILLGIPVLRMRGDYLAIVTLGFGEIIRLLFTNLRDYTGGPQGVLNIPRPLPSDASGPVMYLSLIYLVFLGAGLVAFCSNRLKNSRTGRAWNAMRSDEDIAQSMGVNLVQSKLMAFAIGAAFAGAGGVLFAARQRAVFPRDFNLDVSIEVLSLVIIGGMGSTPGVIMGAIALIGVPEVLRELATYRILVFGALLVTMVIIRPKGLLPTTETSLQERARALVHPDEAEGEEVGA